MPVFKIRKKGRGGEGEERSNKRTRKKTKTVSRVMFLKSIGEWLMVKKQMTQMNIKDMEGRRSGPEKYQMNECI